METEKLYELVREEKILLWAGAGLSLYGGYPSAEGLKTILLKNLGSPYKRDFKNYQLEMVAEQYVKIKGRSQLNSLLKEIFQNQPTSVQLHTAIAKIPHIREIVTTNYDEMFERAYLEEVQVVADVMQLSDISKRKVNLFKIHGDINFQSNIIISKTDYSNFYIDAFNNVYWTTIKERIVNNDVLFIGYGLGDININTILTSISKQLGENRRNIFIIAPNFKSYEVDDLKQKGIHYIDSDAENFFKGLTDNIKLNIVSDFKHGRIGKDTYHSFLLKHDLTGDFIANNTSHEFTNIRPLKAAATGQIRLQTKYDSKLAEQLNDYFSGRILGDLRIDGKQTDRLEYSLNGIRFFDSDSIQEIIISRRPNISMICDVCFDNGFEYRKIEISIFTSEHKALWRWKMNSKIIEFDYSSDNSSPTFYFTHGESFSSSRDEIETYKMVKYLASGVKFTMFSPGLPNTEHQIEADESFVKMIDSYLNYFELLWKVERHFKFRLDNIPEITDQYFRYLAMLDKAIDGEIIYEEMTGIMTLTTEEYDDEFIEGLRRFNDKYTHDLILPHQEGNFYLYGKKFIIPHKILRVHEPYFINLDDLRNKTTKDVKLISRAKKVSEQYSSGIYIADVEEGV